jgi:serine/threonine-protein kinase
MTRPDTLGSYPVERELGRGGMGVVYLARDPRLDRPVAIKVVPDALSKNPDSLARFEREARLLASVTHPNVAAIYSVEEAAGQRLLVMEYVPGDTLADRLTRGPLSVEAALDVCRQIAAGIEAAHEAGIVHRDLKPGNVKITPDETVKVLDFGLAKGGAASSTDLAQSPTLTYSPTAIGVILGTAGYMSPEQARGKPVDRRADVWAFGCVLFECLTGRKTFEGETVSDTIARILEREPAWESLPAGTPPRVRDLLRRCLEKDLKKRQRDIGDVRIELEEILALRSSAMRTAEHAPMAMPPPVWRRTAISALLVVVGAGVGIGVWSFARPAGAPATPVSMSINMPPNLRPVRASLLQRSPAILIHGYTRLPDGNEDPVARLYRRPLDSFELTPIAGTEGVQAFTLSPDERWIVARKALSAGSTDHRLVKVPLDGSSPPITLAEWNPEWGGFIWLEDNDLLIEASQGSRLVRLPTGGGGPKPAITVQLEGASGYPDLEEDLPGGRGVLMNVESWGPRGYQEDVWLLDATTGKAKRLVENGSGAEYQAETGYLLFSRQSSLMAVRLDLATLSIQGELIALFDGLRSASWSNGAFRVAHAGHLLFHPGGRIGLDRRLVIVGPSRDVTPFIADARSFETAIDASADGRQVAVVIPTAGGTYETWTASIDRPGLRRTLAIPNADAAGAYWSPNGQWLAFGRVGRDGKDGAYVQRADGSGEPRLVMKSPAADQFVLPTGWTADGTGLLIGQFGSRGDIFLVPVDGAGVPGQARPIRTTPASETEATMSPDGRLLAFYSDESGAVELYVAEFANGAVVGQPLLVVGATSSRIPRWSRDSRRLFFARELPDRIMSVSIERVPSLRTSPATVAFDPRALRLDPRVWTILPGDRLLGIQRGVGEDEVTSYQIILNWLDTVRERLPLAAR